MNIDEFIQKTLTLANETFPAICAMVDYEEADFLGVICAMIEMYAEQHNLGKFKLASEIYFNMRKYDHE